MRHLKGGRQRAVVRPDPLQANSLLGLILPSVIRNPSFCPSLRPSSNIFFPTPLNQRHKEAASDHPLDHNPLLFLFISSNISAVSKEYQNDLRIITHPLPYPTSLCTWTYSVEPVIPEWPKQQPLVIPIEHAPSRFSSFLVGRGGGERKCYLTFTHNLSSRHPACVKICTIIPIWTAAAPYLYLRLQPKEGPHFRVSPPPQHPKAEPTDRSRPPVHRLASYSLALDISVILGRPEEHPAACSY
ncbi:hypothetical protein V8C35DRAFT_210461 [Trichoderma chlorosporum]